MASRNGSGCAAFITAFKSLATGLGSYTVILYAISVYTECARRGRLVGGLSVMGVKGHLEKFVETSSAAARPHRLRSAAHIKFIIHL